MSVLDDYAGEFTREMERLSQTLVLARNRLAAAELTREEKETIILAAKVDMPDDTAHALAGLSSANSFEDLVELSQYAYMVAEHVAEHDSAAQNVRRFRSMVLKPYFARVDFVFADTGEKEAVYIGRYSLRDEASREIAVYDWRSPIAGVFYRFGTGPAFYEAPGGRIDGQVLLKRQFEILRGQLEYFFDADVEIVDEFLRKLLSQNAAPQMKTIVETIQRDQDVVIRDQEHDVVMVQGAAGSGKTSIALHRAAYLMYQGIAGAGLSSSQIVIISPNRLFEGYISHVLPELGEQSVRTMVFEEVFERTLDQVGIDCEVQSKNRLLEELMAPAASAGSAGLACQTVAGRALAFKMSETFVEILKRFVYEIPRRWIPFADAEYGGRLVMSRELIQAKVLQREKHVPLGVRLRKTQLLIRQNVHKMRERRLKELRSRVVARNRHPFDTKEYVRMLSIRESTAMIRRVKAFTEIDVFALYCGLFRDEGAFYRLAEGLSLPPDMGEILAYCRESLGLSGGEEGVGGYNSEPSTDRFLSYNSEPLTDRFLSDNSEPLTDRFLSYADAAALTFLWLVVSGHRDFAGIHQVVVDEAQDYYPLHYAILRALFPKAHYTVLGDINQSIEKAADSAIYSSIPRILGKENPALLTLSTSFRSTREIIDFSAGLLGEGARIKSFSRSGEAPVLSGVADRDELRERMLEEIEVCLAAGHQSVGIICKTEREAREVYRLLAPGLRSLGHKAPVRLIGADCVEELAGVSVLPIYMAKGLEFDAVIVCGVDAERYASEDDRRLLYIACTRALHRLSLFYEGEASRFFQVVQGSSSTEHRVSNKGAGDAS
ncbi:MAG: AAA family ATPase [Peptococcaceae bacterium]|nr:AAA family ATPase [Peptococcaceae bacterium]